MKFLRRFVSVAAVILLFVEACQGGGGGGNNNSSQEVVTLCAGQSVSRYGYTVELSEDGSVGITLSGNPQASVSTSSSQSSPGCIDVTFTVHYESESALLLRGGLFHANFEAIMPLDKYYRIGYHD